MARSSHPPDLASLGFGDEFDEVLRGANPNPTRHGCPSHSVLVTLARRERPIADPTYDHLLECSPCYIEVRDMQQKHLVKAHNRRTRKWLIAGVSALITASLLAYGLHARRS